MIKTKKTSKVKKAVKVSLGEFALAIHDSYLCQHALSGKEKTDFISRLLALPEDSRASVYKIFQDEKKEQGKLDAEMEKELSGLRADYLKKLRVVVKSAKKKATKKHEANDRLEEEKAAEELLNQL